MEWSFWMYNLSRLDLSYILEVHRFVDAAKNHALRTKTKHIYCPCIDFRNINIYEDTEAINFSSGLPRIYEGLLDLDEAWRG